MSTPYIGFSNETLAQGKQLAEGDEVMCPGCRERHVLETGTNEGKKSNLLLFYRCGTTSFLAAVAGHSVMGRKADVSGQISDSAREFSRSNDRKVCDHGVTFDPAAARGLSAHTVRKQWPRLFGKCPLGCGFDGISYASLEHMIMGDW